MVFKGKTIELIKRKHNTIERSINEVLLYYSRIVLISVTRDSIKPSKGRKKANSELHRSLDEVFLPSIYNITSCLISVTRKAKQEKQRTP